MAEDEANLREEARYCATDTHLRRLQETLRVRSAELYLDLNGLKGKIKAMYEDLQGINGTIYEGDPGRLERCLGHHLENERANRS